MEIVIVTGATREPLDDVRYLTNVSTGRLGYEVARAFVARGAQVRLLGPPDLEDRRWYQLALKPLAFTGVLDLQGLLLETLAHRPADAVVMAAAISDYRFADVHGGKLSSDSPELVLRLVRAPKILGSLRKACGRSTVLVGFKLLSGASRDELVRVARHQMARDDLDLTLANDLTQLGGVDHPAVLVQRNGAAQDLGGSKSDVAAVLARVIAELIDGQGWGE